MRTIILFLSFSLFLFSCDSGNRADKIVVNPGFSDYVNAFTSGVISSSSNIQIVLNEASDKAKPGSVLPDGIFELDPHVDGQAVWVNERTVEFRPSEGLKSGESYVVSFELGKVLQVPSEFSTLEIGVKVIQQSLFFSNDGLNTPDMSVLEKQELKGSLRTSDVANNEAIEQCLTATQDGKELAITWEHTEGSKVHKYLITDIARGNSESFVMVKWNGEPIGSDVSNEKEIRIPPLGEFALLQIKTQRKPSLHFSIQFSDPVKPGQDLSGLIYLRSGKRLRLQIVGNEIKAYPGQNMSGTEIVVVDKAIVNTAGNQLQNSWERKVEFNLTQPAVQLLGEGVIMPTNGEISFPFKAVNLKGVNVRVIQIFEDNIPQFLQTNQLDGTSELTRVGRLVYDGSIDLVSDEAIDYGVWNNFSVNIADLIEPEAGAIYRVLLSFERYQSLFPCGNDGEVIKPFTRNEPNFDDGVGYFRENSWYLGGYEWDEKNDPCTDSYYRYYQRAVGANIIASNFGIIAKESAANTYDVVVTDLRTAESLSGIEVRAYNYQMKEMSVANTNSDGVAHIQLEHKPYLMIAKRGEQVGYLRVDNGSALSMSLFEVGGKDIKEGVKGFIYGERGIWRPGDTMHLAFMLEDKQNVLPDDHPVVFELYDPQGKLYDKRVSTSGVNGLYAFKMYTLPGDITGVWQARAQVGNSTFYKGLKVETIKPNKMAISFDFPDVIPSNEVLRTTLNAKWLYGAPGSGLEASVQYSLANLNTTFEGYEDYQFDDRSKRFYSSGVETKKSATDSEGNASFSFDFEEPYSSPGMLRANFSTKVFEGGGDYSQDFVSVKYSPFRAYCGLKVDGGKTWMNALNSEEEHAVALALVDEFGKPLSRTVNIKLYKLGWNWWWEGSSSDELTQYINAYSKDLIVSDQMLVQNGKARYNLAFNQKRWGRMLLVVEDPESGHSASQLLFVDYPGWWSNDGSGSDAASMLSIQSKKKKYEVGEEVSLSVPSGGVGRIYITVEKGDKILDQFWVDADDESTEFTFKSTKDMAPNVYVSATLIQPHAQTENSLPIRLYGVTPVYINDDETHVKPVLSAPEETRPESTFKVTVKEEKGKAMAYTLAVVDEGLLNLTRFKTPNPWHSFYSKEALKVRTWDMYKYVMDAQTGKMIPLLAVGGDEALSMEDQEDVKRFKPVVRYYGPFFLDKGESHTQEVDIPNYIGAVRIMAVAGYQGAYGSSETKVKVRQPLMVSTTLPRVLGPSEKVRIPVNVICMDKSLGTVKVKIQSNELISITGSKTQEVNFDKEGEKTIFFEASVAKKLGKATVRVDLSSGSEKAYEEIEIGVRAPNPYITQSKNDAIDAGKAWSADYTAVGIQGSNSAALQISTIPDMDLQKNLNYLIRYPHGCIEQTTSGAFPQLFLAQFVELSEEQKEKVENNIRAGLNRLRQFQLPHGGLSYWPESGGYVSEWGTNYAGHFMLEAKNKGYDLPPGMLDQWIKFQRTTAANWSRDAYRHWSYNGSDLVQSYRLYTLALAGKAEIGAMNRLMNDRSLSNVAAWRLAAAYAIIGREDAARKLATRSTDIQPYRSMGYTYGSRLRDMAMIIETMAYLKDRERGAQLIQSLAKDLKSGWHSTQTRAYSMLAIAKFIGSESVGNNSMDLDIVVNGKSKGINTDAPIFRLELDKADLMSGNITVTNKSGQLVFVNLTQSGIPLEMNEAPVSDDLNMKIMYRNMDNTPLDISKLEQGQDFKAVVVVTHPGYRSPYSEIALNQIFPSGWQIVNTRMMDQGSSSNKFNYQDIRDDRVYTYFDLDRSKSVDFEILLNATFCGKYYMPGVFCAPMYDESIKASEPGKWVEVIPRETPVN